MNISLEVTKPGGVVVIPRYWFAQSEDQLPVNRVRFDSATIGPLGSAADKPFTGDKSRPDDGYRGIWFTLGQFSEHGDKYSGGLGTYTANHIPVSAYAPEVKKTFFVYGGTVRDQRHLLIMASYYDHENHRVPRPTIVHDKKGVNDPHDNAAMTIDDKGHIWVFISGRGRARPGFTYRSARPYDVSEFQFIREEEFTYPQPWFHPDHGFFHLITKYTAGRELYWETSKDGLSWNNDKKLAALEGHYQVSNMHRPTGKIGTFFNRHPGHSVDKRTDLYYLETSDWGETWTTADGTKVDVPLTNPDNPARVINYSEQGKLMYTIDLRFDENAHPVLLYITSRGFKSGPQNGPREWTLSRWTGEKWETSVVTKSDHNYDLGSLFLGKDEWTIIGPTETGPQPYGTGGEIAVWKSTDKGKTWKKTRQVTRDSEYNHAYVRRPLDATDPFYVFWADGDPRQVSRSHLYFGTSDGTKYWQLPYDMEGEFATPRLMTP